MIQLTRLNKQPLMVNSDLIKFVEKSPDTVLTLITGEKIIVCEATEVVLDKIVAFRQSVISGSSLLPPYSSSVNTLVPPAAPPPPEES